MQPPKLFPSLLPWKLCPFFFSFLPIYGASLFVFSLSLMFYHALSSTFNFSSPAFALTLHLCEPVSMCMFCKYLCMEWRCCSIAHTLCHTYSMMTTSTANRFIGSCWWGFDQWGRFADNVRAEGMQHHGNCRGCHKRRVHSSGTRCLCLCPSAWMTSPLCLRELLLLCATYLFTSNFCFCSFFVSNGHWLDWLVLSIKYYFTNR